MNHDVTDRIDQVTYFWMNVWRNNTLIDVVRIPEFRRRNGLLRQPTGSSIPEKSGASDFGIGRQDVVL